MKGQYFLLMVLSFGLTACGGSETTTATTPPPPTNNTIYPSFGPDASQCPITLADRGAETIHICDCQTGADASCIAGDDANNGTVASPLRTLSQVANAINNGDDVALCRGGVWETTTDIHPNLSNCSEANPCTVQDYGDSAIAKPLIKQLSSDQGGFTLDPGG